jgi:lipid A ethanolaminephosphotransferase
MPTLLHPHPFRPPRLRRLPHFEISVERLVLLAALYWTLSANTAFFRAALQGRELADRSAWGFALALLLGLVALHVLLLGLVAQRRWIKPVLALLTVATALGSHFIGSYGVYLDPSMLRNALHTQPGEAGELLNAPLAWHLLLYAGLPLLLLWRVRLLPGTGPWWRATLRRLGWLALALGLLVAALLSVFQPLASLMRNHREVRYLITPANLVWSMGAVIAADAKGAAKPRTPIGLDTSRGPSWTGATRPRVVLLVVGETARAANWGLNDYARQTTPLLAQRLQTQPAGAGGLINFPQVSACGTNTETSLPCMFAPVGRRDYDEGRIRGEESLLHLAARAGVAVHWRDNQSGCKGVCDGLPGDTVTVQHMAVACPDDHCLDEGLIADLPERLRQAAQAGAGTQLWVLHMLGNHGPAYHRRVPTGFARFQPACTSDDLRQCTPKEIVNAYDNALLYTDHLLERTIALLQAQADSVDSALIYVSDHGESLGEHGLFLHGMPYAIAPDVQKQVPMVAWLSPGMDAAVGLTPGCLRPALERQAARPLAHDHLFHTLLGLLDLRTGLHASGWDLTAPCRTTEVTNAPVKAATR